MRLGEPDSSGRRRPIPVEGSKIIIKADRLITAIGQRPVVPKNFALSMGKKGTIQADAETMSCSMNGVFAGGDAVSGPASIIEAIQAARYAAISIDKYLGGKGEIDQKFILEEEGTPCLGREERFAYKKRVKMPSLSVAKRLHSFSQVEYGLNEKRAVQEAERCLRCELRLKISKAPLPSKIEC